MSNDLIIHIMITFVLVILIYLAYSHQKYISTLEQKIANTNTWGKEVMNYIDVSNDNLERLSEHSATSSNIIIELYKSVEDIKVRVTRLEGNSDGDSASIKMLCNDFQQLQEDVALMQKRS